MLKNYSFSTNINPPNSINQKKQMEKYDDYIRLNSRISYFDVHIDKKPKSNTTNTVNVVVELEQNINYKLNLNPIPNSNPNNLTQYMGKILHLSVNYLNERNDWKSFNTNANSQIYYTPYDSDTLKYLKTKYMCEKINEFSQNNKIYLMENYFQIISEVGKSVLDLPTFNSNTNFYTSTTLLNEKKIYDGISQMEILTNPDKIFIKQIQIRTRAKNINNSNQLDIFENQHMNNPHINNQPNDFDNYRNIVWDLEFEPTPYGYKILGLDDFMHISFVGCEEIFLDIVYDSIETNVNLYPMELKYSRCVYNNTIKTNLKKNLYANEEYYVVDIIDWITQEQIDIDMEEKQFGNIYGTNYNILRMMSGMSGLSYSN